MYLVAMLFGTTVTFPWQVKPPGESFCVFSLTHQLSWFVPNQLPIYFCTLPCPPLVKQMPGLLLRNFFPCSFSRVLPVCIPNLLSLLQHFQQYSKASLKISPLESLDSSSSLAVDQLLFSLFSQTSQIAALILSGLWAHRAHSQGCRLSGKTTDRVGATQWEESNP